MSRVFGFGIEWAPDRECNARGPIHARAWLNIVDSTMKKALTSILFYFLCPICREDNMTRHDERAEKWF